MSFQKRIGVDYEAVLHQHGLREITPNSPLPVSRKRRFDAKKTIQTTLDGPKWFENLDFSPDWARIR